MKYQFSQIKRNYTEVKSFLENASGLEIESLDTKIVDDLGLWGDENFFLLNDYAEKYKVDLSKFNYPEHFDSEVDLFRCKSALFAILLFPIYITNSLYKTVYQKNGISFLDYILPMIEDKKDLTFGDLLTSKLKGEFCLRKNAQIELLK